MKQADIAERLILVEESIARIEAGMSTRIPADEIRAAMNDVLDILNITSQLAEIIRNQRDQLAMLVGLAAELLTEARTETKESRKGRDNISDLLIQLRELGRTHVRALADLERKIEAVVEE